jgi:CDP-glucose 4,6-dehydratase
MPRAMPDPAFWSGRRVLVTGHTGFKGHWLTLWLRALGAEVTGFARRDGGDVADAAAVRAAVAGSRPEVVFHLASLATVQLGYDDPAAVYTANVVGTANVLQAVRESDSVRVVVGVTSDKCYLDQGSEWAYREDDRLGGHDPYSSSKAAQELVIAAFRDSILAARGIAVASVRAGNVIGGGDRTQGRLVPDLIRAALAGEPLEVRAPHARRPWQHVLNPLEGYLLLAQRLADDPTFAGAWNFGPAEQDSHPVEWIVERMRSRWPGGLDVRYAERPPVHEAAIPRVDSTRARTRLAWRPPWDLAAAIDMTVEWHLGERDGRDPDELSLEQIERHGAMSAATS